MTPADFDEFTLRPAWYVDADEQVWEVCYGAYR
jgi:hypothetical protein